MGYQLGHFKLQRSKFCFLFVEVPRAMSEKWIPTMASFSDKFDIAISSEVL